MNTIKAMLGNVFYRLTGDNSYVDKEWNKKQSGIPNKKSWINLLIIFPLLLIALFLSLYFIAK